MVFEQKVEIRGPSGSSRALVLIDEWTPQRKRREGLKYWSICWLLILPAIFVPIAHFVLVPLLLILGPGLFFIYLKKQTTVSAGKGQCPECQGLVEFDHQGLKWPFEVVCQKNYDHLKVFKA